MTVAVVAVWLHGLQDYGVFLLVAIERCRPERFCSTSAIHAAEDIARFENKRLVEISHFSSERITWMAFSIATRVVAKDLPAPAVAGRSFADIVAFRLGVVRHRKRSERFQTEEASIATRPFCTFLNSSAGSAPQLADAVGMNAVGGSFQTYLSRLRALELIEGKGALRASGELFQ